MKHTQEQLRKIQDAAPELLEALENLIEWDKQYPPQKIYSHDKAQVITDQLTKIVDKAKLAVQKATQL